MIVPVKRLGLAKTRLRPYDVGLRRALALAMACDVVAAVGACPGVVQVLVVSRDPDVAAALAAQDVQDVQAAQLQDAHLVQVVPDEPDAGLDAALLHGAALLAPGLGVAALTADLPALLPEDLHAALHQVTAGRGVVADVLGTGTTLLAAAAGTPLRPAYGPGSLTRHLQGGARRLRAAPGLRQDVDTPADLAKALRLGVGPRTAAVAAGLP